MFVADLWRRRWSIALLLASVSMSACVVLVRPRPPHAVVASAARRVDRAVVLSDAVRVEHVVDRTIARPLQTDQRDSTMGLLANDMFSSDELSHIHQLVTFVRDSRDEQDPTREAAWFHSRVHPTRSAVLVVSTNSGGFRLFTNMICSLIRSNASYLVDHTIVWALDDAVIDKLVRLRSRLKDDSFLTRSGSLEHQYAQSEPLFGIYFDPLFSAVAAEVSWDHGKDNLLHMMSMRGQFFHRLISKVKVDFVFSDSDIFYKSDPFVALNLPWGIPDRELRLAEKQRKLTGCVGGADDSETMIPVRTLFNAVPDLIYSTDARKPYQQLADPYEGRPLMPELCGGFFFARANRRTLVLFESIRRGRLNDQWDLVSMLNYRSSVRYGETKRWWEPAYRETVEGVNSVIVDPLPAGLKTRKPWYPLAPSSSMRRATSGRFMANKATFQHASDGSDGGWLVSRLEAEDIIRIRILSQASFSNALEEHAQLGTRGPGYHKLVRELEERGEREVLFHANGHANKSWILDQLDMWALVDGATTVSPKIPSADEAGQLYCSIE